MSGLQIVLSKTSRFGDIKYNVQCSNGKGMGGYGVAFVPKWTLRYVGVISLLILIIDQYLIGVW